MICPSVWCQTQSRFSRLPPPLLATKMSILSLLVALALLTQMAFESLTVCRRPCSCLHNVVTCVNMPGLTQLPDLSQFNFVSVRVHHTSVKEVECQKLSPNLRLLDLRHTNVSKANVCALLLRCERVRIVESSFDVTDCAKTDTSIIVNPSSADQTTPSRVTPEMSGNSCVSYQAFGSVLSLLGAIVAVCSFFWYCHRLAQLKLNFRAQIRRNFSEQERHMRMTETEAQTSDEEVVEMFVLASEPTSVCDCSICSASTSSPKQTSALCHCTAPTT